MQLYALKARGKDSNVRQMGGSFGIALVGGKRILTDINPFDHWRTSVSEG